VAKRTLSAQRGETYEIMNKLCQTNPIFKMPKMNITDYKAKRYNEISSLAGMKKRTQTKPILSALVADKIVPSAVEGPIVEPTNPTCGERSRTIYSVLIRVNSWSIKNPFNQRNQRLNFLFSAGLL
jgi:hypothetical protein